MDHLQFIYGPFIIYFPFILITEFGCIILKSCGEWKKPWTIRRLKDATVRGAKDMKPTMLEYILG